MPADRGSGDVDGTGGRVASGGVPDVAGPGPLGSGQVLACWSAGDLAAGEPAAARPETLAASVAKRCGCRESSPSRSPISRAAAAVSFSRRPLRATLPAVGSTSRPPPGRMVKRSMSAPPSLAVTREPLLRMTVSLPRRSALPPGACSEIAPFWRSRVVVVPASPAATGRTSRRWPPVAGLTAPIRTPCARSDCAAGPFSFRVVESPAPRATPGGRAATTTAIAAAVAMPANRLAATPLTRGPP